MKVSVTQHAHVTRDDDDGDLDQKMMLGFDRDASIVDASVSPVHAHAHAV
jgi:hypothetical protein